MVLAACDAWWLTRGEYHEIPGTVRLGWFPQHGWGLPIFTNKSRESHH